ncbi:MAG TPA: hypothetical protein PKV98_13515 [Burkholderiaceae bacterium]|nr:hypothetical protein [Burkholderiaceae bacterium]
MSWLTDLLDKYGRPDRVTTTPWMDLGATTAEPMSIKKPINIKRVMMTPRHLMQGDNFDVTISWKDENGNLIAKERAPTFEIDRHILVDSVTKFEVVDDFGVDVGIGFVLGQAKR